MTGILTGKNRARPNGYLHNWLMMIRYPTKQKISFTGYEAVVMGPKDTWREGVME